MDFLDYYRENLGYLRTLGAEFAAEFPKIAARLDLSAFECQDPYVERLLEGTAFLAARVEKNWMTDTAVCWNPCLVPYRRTL